MSERLHDSAGESDVEERYKDYVDTHPEVKIPPENLKDYKELVDSLKRALDYIEQNFDLEGLFAITHITPEEAPKHPIREPARQALILIHTALKNLKETTSIPPDLYEELHKRYKHISRAVGIINKDVVDHDR